MLFLRITRGFLAATGCFFSSQHSCFPGGRGCLFFRITRGFVGSVGCFSFASLWPSWAARECLVCRLCISRVVPYAAAVMMRFLHWQCAAHRADSGVCSRAKALNSPLPPKIIFGGRGRRVRGAVLPNLRPAILFFAARRARQFSRLVGFFCVVPGVGRCVPPRSDAAGELPDVAPDHGRASAGERRCPVAGYGGPVRGT